MYALSFIATACLVGFLTLLTTTASGSAQVVPLNVGYIRFTDRAIVESFAGGIQPDSADEVQEALSAGIRMALYDLQTESVLPQYNLTLVTATIQNNTYSDVYNATTQLIQQKVAVIAILIGNLDFLQYVTAIAEGFRVPVLTFSCKLALRQDDACLSSAVRGESALQYFRAANRLGFNRTVYIYNPNSVDSSLVETFATEMSSQIQVQSIQTRTDLTNATIQQIIDSRTSSIIMTGSQALPAYRTIRAIMGPERAKLYTFLAQFGGGLTVSQIWSTFKIGEEDGLFTMETEAPAALQLAYSDRILREGWANTTDKNVAILTAILRVTSYRFYNLLRMWAYGFEKLTSGQTPTVIASDMNSRPKVNRQVYYGNESINAALGARLRNVSGIPILFTRYSISRPNLTEYNKTQPLWTPECKIFLGFVDDPGRITNATFGDKSNIAPPDRVPLPIRSFGSSPIRSAGFAVAGIIIAFDVLLFALLLILRSVPSIKSASWVFMGTTLAGSICLAVALFLTTSDPTAAECNATPVLITLGLHLVLVSIAVKAFRLSIIFHNKVLLILISIASMHLRALDLRAEDIWSYNPMLTSPSIPVCFSIDFKYNRRVTLQDDKLALIIVTLYIPDIILLAIWLSTHPFRVIYVEEGGDSQVLKCYSDAPGFPWGLFGYGLAKLLVALRYTYLTRNVYSRYNETKTVLFAVYNVIIGLVIGLVSFVITGLQREGSMILLLIALSVTSFGTSASVVGTRVIYAFVEMMGGSKRLMVSSGRDSASNRNKSETEYEQEPQILGRPSTRGFKDTPEASASGYNPLVAPWTQEPANNANEPLVGKKKDQGYIGQGDAIGFEGSIRQRSILVGLSKWYTCLIMIVKVNAEPYLSIAMYDDATGSGKLSPTRSVILARDQVLEVAVVMKNAVKIDTTKGVYDVDFPSGSLASQFVEMYQKRMGKNERADNKSNNSKANNVRSTGEVS